MLRKGKFRLKNVFVNDSKFQGIQLKMSLIAQNANILNVLVERSFLLLVHIKITIGFNKIAAIIVQ